MIGRLAFIGLPNFLNAVNTIASLVMALAAIWAVKLAGPQLHHNTRALQIQVFDSIFKDIRHLEHLWIEKNFEHEMTKQEKQAWCASFFNTLEYLCFLMNHNMVRHDELQKFFGTAFPAWWEQFSKYRQQGLLHDSDAMFTEFKEMARNRNYERRPAQSATLPPTEKTEISG